MNLNFVLNRNDILREVNGITGYTGKQVEERFDNIASTEDEEPILVSLYDESIAQLLPSFSAYNPSFANDSLCFDVPLSFNADLSNMIEKELARYLINEICYRWFKITKPDEVDYYSMQAARILSNLKTIFNMRVKPVRRPVRPMGF